MANCYRLQVRKTQAALERDAASPDELRYMEPPEQPWYPRIVAGNGRVVYTGETMHNRSDAAASLAKLVMAIQAHEFRYEFPDD